MCWSEEVSIATFIIGTVINVLVAYAIPTPTIIALAFVMEIVVTVQLFEALGWHSIKTGDKEMGRGAASGLMVAVMLQPIVMALALLAVSDATVGIKALAGVIALLYAGWCLYVLTVSKKHYLVGESCSHLEYQWWDDFPLGGIPYLFALFAMIILLVRPVDLSIFVALFLALAFGFSFLFYRRNVGSIWCWIGAFTMAFIAAYWVIRNKYIASRTEVTFS